MAGMARYPDGYFHLAIVDPEYGINAGSFKFGNGAQGRKVKYLDGKKWDKTRPSERYFHKLFRVSKNQIICGGNYFSLPPTRGFIFWYKSAQMAGRSYAEGEYIWTSFDTNARMFEYAPMTGYASDKIHPTQKPIALYKWLLTNYAKPGDRILDTHLGSGSSRIAAYDMGFDFWAWENDPDYFAGQQKRFEAHVAKPVLFAPEEMYQFEQAKLF